MLLSDVSERTALAEHADARPTERIPPRRDQDIEIAYAALEALEENAARIGLVVSYQTDFDEFVRLRALSPDGVVNPILNPKFSKLDRDAFWLQANTRDGALAAMLGAKVFRVQDVMTLVRNERLWYDRHPVHEVDRRAQPLPAFGAFGGTVSHAAGGWTAPQFRIRGLANFLSDYARALLIKNHGIDWATATTIGKYVKGFTSGLGYETAPLFDGWCTMIGAEVDLHLCRIRRADIVARLRHPALLPVNWAEAPVPATVAR
jgi:hypothetical protein